MIFPESFPVFYSLSLVIVFSTVIFFWRFYIFRKKLLQSFLSLPTVVVLGMKNCGKSSFIRMLTNSQIISHPIQDGFNFSTLTIGNQKVQLIEVPHFVDAMATHLNKFKKMKLIGGFYIFDVSKESEPVESQIENFEKIKGFLKDIPLVPVVSKVDVADAKKLEKIKGKFKEIYEVQLAGELDKIRQDLLTKELEDLKQLIYKITQEIEVEKKI